MAFLSHYWKSIIDGVDTLPTDMRGISTGYVLSIDSGTSGCKASVWSSDGKLICVVTEPLDRIFPRTNYVEQDPAMIWDRQLSAIKSAISRAGIDISNITSLGITNQRETVVAWDSETGMPLYNAISWMDRRTREYEDRLSASVRAEIKKKTGLVVNPYFSAMKMKWIIDYLHRKHNRIASEKIRLGTIDSWIIWKLTSGRVHATDWSNASRTMLFDLSKGVWDQDLLEEFGISETMLPEVVDSIGCGISTERDVLGSEIDIDGMAGDQQASLFGHLALDRGEMKNTYGTGSFLLVNAGNELPITKRLISTVAWKQKGKRPVYAIEGSSFNSGSLLDWIRDGLKILRENSESDAMAGSSLSDHGLYFVPALTGLGAPYWDSRVKGAIIGITPNVTSSDIVRSALDSIAYRIRDMVEATRKETRIIPREIKVDGKPTANGYLMQFQSDMLQLPVLTYKNSELTSAGAAYMAGIAAGIWDTNMLKNLNPVDREFTPKIRKTVSDHYYREWKRAVRSTVSLYSH